MKRLPLGIQTFRKVVDGGHVYVDKTRYIHDLLCNESYYFLSRPRRFGKSLLLDTIAEVFNGSRELFEGLFIYDCGYGFEKHPVVRLDMSNIENENPDDLKNSLVRAINSRSRDEGFELIPGLPSNLFQDLIKMLYDKYGKGVVVLIDEYDKPILDRINNMEIAEQNRDVLRRFYGILKSSDPYLRFIFITGVSKFTKTSIFSELNNLRDITMSNMYAGICGVPVEQLGRYFGEHLEKHKRHQDVGGIEDLHKLILKWYDGYSWDGVSRLINPFSLLSFLIDERLYGFWFASGSPKFLMDLIKEKPASYIDLKNLEMSEWALDSFDIKRMEIVPLLFQTGYLTVKEIKVKQGRYFYQLEMPNMEVKEAFHLNIMAELSGKDGAFAESSYFRMRDALISGKPDEVLVILKSLFAGIPYQIHIDREAYYQSIFYAVLTVLGFDINAEVQTAKGRIDAVLELENKVYVIEFKYKDCPPDTSEEDKRKLFDKALEEGIKQITDRGYHKKYESDSREIIKATFAFLGRYEIEMVLF